MDENRSLTSSENDTRDGNTSDVSGPVGWLSDLPGELFAMFQLIPWLCVLLLTFFLVDWYRRQPRIADLTRLYVFVSGCDTGFGKMLVRRLDAVGCNVFAGCLTESGQVDIRQLCTNRVKTVSIDVTDSLSVRRAYDFVSRLVPAELGLWGLVNNAAIPGVSTGPLEWLEADDFRRVFDVNTAGLIDVTLTFLPLLKKGRGRIVNMSSTGGRLAGPLALPYDVSKHGVEAFSDGLRQHLRLYKTGVTVHVIEPSMFRTEMLDPEKHKANFENTWKRLQPKVREEYGDSFHDYYLRYDLDAMTRVASTEYHKVIDAYVHALTSVSPRHRYTVGYRAMFFSIPLSYLPSSFVDWVVCTVYPTIKMARPFGHVDDNLRMSLTRNVRFTAPR